MPNIRGKGSLLCTFALLSVILTLLSGCGNFYALTGINSVTVSNYSTLNAYYDTFLGGSSTGFINQTAIGYYNMIATDATASAHVNITGNSHVVGYVFLASPSPTAAVVHVAPSSSYFGNKVQPTPISSGTPTVTPSGTNLGNLTIASGTQTPSSSDAGFYYQNVYVSGAGVMNLNWGNTYVFQSLTVSSGGTVQTVPNPTPTTAPALVEVTGTGANLLNFNGANINMSTKFTNNQHVAASLIIYCNPTISSATIAGHTNMTGILYAANTNVNITLSQVYGAITGLNVSCNASQIHYDTALTSELNGGP